jgi:hypothetical protein
MVGRKYAEALGLQMGNRVVSNYNNLSAVAPIEVKETEVDEKVAVKSIDF